MIFKSKFHDFPQPSWHAPSIHPNMYNLLFRNKRPSAPDSSSGTKGHEILSAVPPKLLLAKPLTYVKGYEPCSFHCQLRKWKDLSFLPVHTSHRLSEKIQNRSFRHRFLLIFCYYSLLYTKKQAHFNALAEVDTYPLRSWWLPWHPRLLPHRSWWA